MAEMTDDAARALRASWFAFVDVAEPHRTALFDYARRLTGSIWAAEDLVQETLLRGFGMIGRGDLHGPDSPVQNVRAYLFRTATHLWIDECRRAARERRALAEPVLSSADDPDAVRSVGETLFTAASPQQRAAVVLKDVFGFSLEEVADQLRTSVGSVKSALHRGRDALRQAQAAPSTVRAPPALLDRFVAAFNAADHEALTALLTDSCSIEVMGVGGGRGRSAVWVEKSIEYSPGRLEVRLLDGQPAVVCLEGADGAPRLRYLVRLEGDEAGVSRIVDYCYARDTLAAAAEALGVGVDLAGYHQRPESLVGMIATTTLPWR
jgi:RNA polymerase sigma-70 factor, ECF subfamily